MQLQIYPLPVREQSLWLECLRKDNAYKRLAVYYNKNKTTLISGWQSITMKTSQRL